MIDELRDRGLLSLVAHSGGVVGYRFAGELLEAYELLDRCLVESAGDGLDPVAHSCTTLIARTDLERIGFFDKLPSLPFRALPHCHDASDPADQGEWLLTPSTCYGTFAHLQGAPERWGLRALTARAHCHRRESSPAQEPTRMWGFDMREVVLIGDPALVTEACDASFGRALALIEAVGAKSEVVTASDVFYGANSDATRRVQRALGVKQEARLPWLDGRPVAVGSRNLHRDLFTRTFAIGPSEAMHSGCVAFGLERLLLTLLVIMPEHDPCTLVDRLHASRQAAGVGA